MLYLGKTMFPATYSTSRAELEKAENFACQLLEVDYFKQRLKRDIIKPLFAYLYQIARE